MCMPTVRAWPPQRSAVGITPKRWGLAFVGGPAKLEEGQQMSRAETCGFGSPDICVVAYGGFVSGRVFLRVASISS